VDYNSTTGCPFYSFFGEGIALVENIQESIDMDTPLVAHLVFLTVVLVGSKKKR